VIFANGVFGAGLILGSHLDDLSDKLKNATQPTNLGSLSKYLGQNEAKLLCSCQHHGGLAPPMTCRILMIQWQLEDLAWKMWICAHTQESCQWILRDIGPNREWKVMNRLRLLPGSDAVPLTMKTSVVIFCMAERLAGRHFASLESPKLLGITSGGAVIALKCYETQPVHLDLGHCLYILPGSIDTAVRRVTEVHDTDFYPGAGFGKWGNAMELSGLRHPLDRFGACQLDHIVQVERGTAFVSTIIKVGEKVLHLRLLDAIDHAPYVRIVSGCLGECAAGQLSDAEIKQARVVDASNYGSLVSAAGTQSPPKLDIVLAHGNVAVQRAVISRILSSEPCLLQMGQCVHCAVREALMRNAKVLLD